MGGVTMSSVLFDVPGPRARARHRLIGAITALLLLAGLVWAIWRLYENNQFEYEKWEPFVTPAIMQDLWSGLLVTLQIAVVSIVFANIFGMLFAVGRLSDHWLISWPCFVVVEFFRAVPVLMMVFFLSIKYASEIGKFWVIAIPLILYNGSVLAEVFRAGIASLDQGQWDGARAIGMNYPQTMRRVILPQAIKRMIPVFLERAIELFKTSTIASVWLSRALPGPTLRCPPFPACTSSLAIRCRSSALPPISTLSPSPRYRAAPRWAPAVSRFSRTPRASMSTASPARPMARSTSAPSSRVSLPPARTFP